MVTNLLLFLVLLVLAAGLAWLAWRAWHLRSIPLRVLAGLPAVLLTLVLLAAAVVTARGLYLIYAPRGGTVADLRVEPTPERIARGERLAASTCAACHSLNGQLPMTGGADLSADIGLPIGLLHPPNLTPAGDLERYSDAQIARALREGIGWHNRPLTGMPSHNLRNLSDEDVASVIAYLRSQPATGTQVPPRVAYPMGVLFVGAGILNIGSPPVAGPVTAPPRGATAEYGKYIVSYSDCRDCHGPDLHGGQGIGPHGPNLALVASWSRDQFISTMRTGVDPGGHQIQPPMPWKAIGKMDDVELSAVYEYLHNLP